MTAVNEQLAAIRTIRDELAATSGHKPRAVLRRQMLAAEEHLETMIEQTLQTPADYQR